MVWPRPPLGERNDSGLWQTSAMATDIETLCDQILEAREAREELKNQLATAETALAEIEGQLAVKLADDGEKVSHGGYSFSSAAKVSWKTRSDGKEKLLGLLKEGAPELVKETVNAASLNSFLKKNEAALEDAQPAWWASAKECVDRNETQALSVRKAAKKKKK